MHQRELSAALAVTRCAAKPRASACISLYDCKKPALSVLRKNRTDAQRLDALPEQADADFIAELDRRADAEALQNAVMQLREPDREIFVRKYYYLESMAALAKRFGMPVKKIDNILYRSKQRLRKILKEDAE